MKDIRLEKLADVLVNYATNVKAGDKVAISGEDCALPFLKAVARAAVKKRGFYRIYYVDVPDIDRELLCNGTEVQYAQPNVRFGACARYQMFGLVHGGVIMSKPCSQSPAQRLKARRLANKENRKLYSDRTASGALRWCGTQFPTNGDAQNAGMSLEEYEDFVYAAGYLYEDDPVSKWKEIAQQQQKWINYLNTKKELHIVSVDTDIYVNVTGRKWINCCGKENFPDGEIFTSPVEDGINGHITFSYPSIINGHEFEQVRLAVEQGRIVEAVSKIQNKMQICFLILIQMQVLVILEKWRLGQTMAYKNIQKIYCLMKKSVVLCIWQSAKVLGAGGKNTSAIHWDMITDMKKCGKIYADGELFYENGKFLEEVCKQNG